jgi:hypothetical protein
MEKDDGAGVRRAHDRDSFRTRVELAIMHHASRSWRRTHVCCRMFCSNVQEDQNHDIPLGIAAYRLVCIGLNATF